MGVGISCSDFDDSAARSPIALPKTPFQSENEMPVGGKPECFHLVLWLKQQNVFPLLTAQAQDWRVEYQQIKILK